MVKISAMFTIYPDSLFDNEGRRRRFNGNGKQKGPTGIAGGGGVHQNSTCALRRRSRCPPRPATPRRGTAARSAYKPIFDSRVPSLKNKIAGRAA